MDETREPGIQIGQVFLEKVEFSHREDALEYPPTTPLAPKIELNFQGGLTPDEKAGFVRIRVRTKPNDRSLYKVDVTMVALVQAVPGKENMPLREYVRTAGPAMLYPFLREAVASLTSRGRFGPIWLNPMNVAAAMAEAAVEHGESPKTSGKIERPSKRKRITA